MSLIAIKSFILNIENDIKVTFEKGEAIAKEYADHWFVKANSVESDQPVIDQETPVAEFAPEVDTAEATPQAEPEPEAVADIATEETTAPVDKK